jgi:hypothetical protein
MNLTELENLAKAVYSPTKDNWEMRHAFAAFNKEANPQTILAMIERDKKLTELLREMGSALLYYSYEGGIDGDVARKALAKYKETTYE